MPFRIGRTDATIITIVIDHYRAVWQEMIGSGGPFAMTEIEVRGIPMRVFDSAPPTMRSVWELAALNGDKTYIVYEDERYSYSEISAMTRALAHHLREVCGIERGDRVAIAMRNYPEWVVAYWATVSLGAAVVGMNAWWAGPEMEYGLTDSSPKVLIADDERLERAIPILPGLRATVPPHIITVRSDRELPDASQSTSTLVRWADVVRAETAPATLPAADIDPDDDACIFYTSGTTGFPKGAQLTHRGSVHNLMNLLFMGMVSSSAEARVMATAGGDAGAAPSAVPARPVFMAPTPLFHVTACNCLLHPCTLIGGTIVLTYKWDPGRALELIEREHVTNFSGVPTMSRELLAHPDWGTRDTSSLVGMAGGGAPVQADLVGKIEKSLAKGSPATGYGLTETHGIVTANSASFYLAKPESCGPVVPTLDAKLIDEAGDDLPSGPDAIGRLCVRGSIVIKGYLNRPEETADAIRDGWFDTGDIARIDDDGFVFIVDRVKDMVLRGGENVYCSEVETAIYQHEDVAEAAVFGIPDERLGEAVAAVVVLRPDSALDEDTLRRFLAERIAKHKIPARFWLRGEQLPRNASGKFLKRELRAELIGN